MVDKFFSDWPIWCHRLVLVYRLPGPIVQKTGLEGRRIPSIPLLLPDSTTWLNSKGIPAGKPFIVMGFSPWCSHCQALTVDIKAHMKDFKDTRIYYITPDSFKNMQAFYRYFKLSQYPNIVMGHDSANLFFQFFGANTTPDCHLRRQEKVEKGDPRPA